MCRCCCCLWPTDSPYDSLRLYGDDEAGLANVDAAVEGRPAFLYPTFVVSSVLEPVEEEGAEPRREVEFPWMRGLGLLPLRPVGPLGLLILFPTF